MNLMTASELDRQRLRGMNSRQERTGSAATAATTRGKHLVKSLPLRHKGVLWGMSVRPEARGTGLAAALVQQVVAHARTLVEQVCLTVIASNVAARRLYKAAGFEEYGLERRGLKVGSKYYDQSSWSSHSTHAASVRRAIHVMRPLVWSWPNAEAS
jgi:ribosomal protein S18 acetylase RimI-like enzyme